MAHCSIKSQTRFTSHNKAYVKLYRVIAQATLVSSDAPNRLDVSNLNETRFLTMIDPFSCRSLI